MVDGVGEWGGCLVDQLYHQTRKYLEASDQLSGRTLCIIWPEHFRYDDTTDLLRRIFNRNTTTLY